MRATKRNLLLLVLLFAAAAATAGKVTYSAFVSTTSSPGNAFASGTVSIRDDDGGGALLTLNAAKPGQSNTGCIEVTYDGSLDAKVRLYATVSGALAPYVTLTVTRGTHAAPAFKSCTGFTADQTNYIGAGAGVVYSGALSQFPASWTAGIEDPTSGSAETWTTSEAHSYRFVVSVNDDNANQGLSASMTFLWEAWNLGSSGGSGYSDAVLDTVGLVGYWRLGESSDTIAADAQGANNGAYENGVTLGTAGAIDESDTAASFDGLDDQVQIPDAASLQPAAISVEAWVQGGAGLEQWDSLLAKVSTDSWDDGYGFYWQADGSLSFFVNNYAAQAVSTALPTDQWTHIVGTFDGSTMTLYKNGEEAASAPFETSITHSSAPLKVGAGGGVGPYAWAGEIDEVALYDVALTPAQIQAHYSAG
jgi:hypothetical protein